MARFDEYRSGGTPSGGRGGLGILGLFVGGAVLLFVGIAALGWLFSFHAVDAGSVCVVREGGWFDGRDIADVRQPGEGPKPIGAWNHQDCLPTTERDSNDVLEEAPAFPTIDRVQVIADGQVLFKLTTDGAKVKEFYKDYGRRKWGGEDITSDKGWVNFLRQRFAPVVQDTLRQTIGSYECVQLNNLCEYVQNPDAAADVKANAKNVDNTQNLNEAQQRIAETLKTRLKAAFHDDYFEDVRYQNLRIRFEPEVQAKITEAQSLRTAAANAKLEAARKKAEAQGEAARKIELAKGEKLAASEQEKTYRLNPTKRSIDRIKAFCGDDGCDPQVIGGGLGDVIAGLSKTG